MSTPASASASAASLSSESSPEPSVIGNDVMDIEKIPARESSSVTKMSEPLDDTNWQIWKGRMNRALLPVLRRQTVTDEVNG
jgi:hypothetical protein